MSDAVELRSERLREKLLKLQKAYCDGVPGRLEEVKRLWDIYCETQDAHSFAEVVSQVHKLAGTATMYGLEELGQLALVTEAALLSHNESDDDKAKYEETVVAMRHFLNWEIKALNRPKPIVD